MRRLILIGILGFTTGCSNAPVAGLLDCVSPARGSRPDSIRGPVVPEIRPRTATDTLPPPADVDPATRPRS